MTFEDLKEYLNNALKDFLNFKSSDRCIWAFGDSISGVIIDIQIIYFGHVVGETPSPIVFTAKLKKGMDSFSIHGPCKDGHYHFDSFLHDGVFGTFSAKSYKTVQEFERAVSYSFEVEPEKIYSKVEYMVEKKLISII